MMDLMKNTQLKLCWILLLVLSGKTEKQSGWIFLISASGGIVLLIIISDANFVIIIEWLLLLG
jgi:hypothetical protein